MVISFYFRVGSNFVAILSWNCWMNECGLFFFFFIDHWTNYHVSFYLRRKVTPRALEEWRTPLVGRDNTCVQSEVERFTWFENLVDIPRGGIDQNGHFSHTRRVIVLDCFEVKVANRQFVTVQCLLTDHWSDKWTAG